jgi:hypothetical protein
MKRLFAFALFAAAPAQSATLPNPNWPNPADRGELLLQRTALGAHNAARHRFGVESLAWSPGLAAEALQHAQYMASTGIYGHDQTPGRRKKQGENLWRGQRGLFSYDVMVRVMVDEARHFRPGAFPNNSATGNWSDVAHFTQIVWPTTTAVGCALASSATTDYFVCRYSPTGNKDGVILTPGGESGTTQLAERGD